MADLLVSTVTLKNLAHLRLAPLKKLIVEIDRGFLHVGPTKSLTFSRGPKGCHVNNLTSQLFVKVMCIR